MDLERLFKLRREVRRNDDISDAASRLFCEIVDLHQLQEGCVATLAKIADYLGKSPRTISRRRDELMEAGYLRTEQRAKCRALVPKWPDEPGEQGQIVPDRFDEQPDKPDETPDTGDGSAPDKFDGHREINIPAEPGEHAREEEPMGEKERAKKLQHLANGNWSRTELAEADERWRTRTYQLAHPDYDPTVVVRSEWKEKITDPAAWAKAILKGWKHGWQAHTTSAREDVYEEFCEEEDEHTYTPASEIDDIRSEIR
jgi:hypothetical protein